MADNSYFEEATPRALEAGLGKRLAKIRLARNITQEALAKEAGLGLRTLRRLEAGGPATLDSFLRVVIALGLADALLHAFPTQEISPILRMDSKRSERKRARPAKAQASGKPWIWKEDEDE